jgi:outer membrane biosynthesis protein TonB
MSHTPLALGNAHSLLLVKATFDAVRKWRYQPTTINGGPVEVAAEVDVTFKL